MYPFTIQIGKAECDGNDYTFTVEQARRIIRWLDRKEYHKFKLIESSGEYHDTLFYGAFNTTPVMNGDDIVGFNAVFQSNAPYGFGEDEKFKTSLTGGYADHATIMDSSDDYGHHYFSCVIDIGQDGDFVLHNNLDEQEVIIKNCSSGERITIDGEHKIIKAELSSGSVWMPTHPRIYNDFNYNYPRLIRTESQNANQLTASLNCNITLTFNPIRKVMVL